MDHIPLNDPKFQLRAGDIASTREGGSVFIESVSGNLAWGTYSGQKYNWDASTGKVYQGPARGFPDIVSIIGGISRLAISFR